MRWKNVWVIGASSGIGHELAMQLVDRADVVACSARSADKLNELSRSSNSIFSYPLDVSDPEAIHDTIDKIETEHGPIDLVVYNPGVWKKFKTAMHFNADDCIQSMNVNYMGAVHVLDKLIPRMIERRKGHIALVGSIAGYRGMKNIPAYGPTKAALINLAETLKLDLQRYNIDVSIINPAFVDTPMTKNFDHSKPFLVSAHNAAKRIIKGLERRKYEIAFPLPMIRLFKWFRYMPNGMFFYIAKRFL